MTGTETDPTSRRASAGPAPRVKTLSVVTEASPSAVEMDEPARRARGRPPRTDRQRATHRARLIGAAMEAIREQGPDVSIDEMANVAGVSKPVLYAEFGDKLGVVDAIAVVLAEGVERTVIATLAGAGTFDTDGAISAIVDGLVTLIDDEPELYAFLVRGLRTSDRGLLDNALVRVIHERALLLVGLVAADIPKDELSILTDGVFGFVFASVESWLSTRRPSKDRLVHTLSSVIRAGLVEVATGRRP